MHSCECLIWITWYEEFFSWNASAMIVSTIRRSALKWHSLFEIWTYSLTWTAPKIWTVGMWRTPNWIRCMIWFQLWFIEEVAWIVSSNQSFLNLSRFSRPLHCLLLESRDLVRVRRFVCSPGHGGESAFSRAVYLILPKEIQLWRRRLMGAISINYRDIPFKYSNEFHDSLNKICSLISWFV
jgi:hypothetical protein